MLLDDKPSHPATFSPKNDLNISKIWTAAPYFIFQCYRPQTWQFYLFFPLLFSFLVLTKCPVLNLRVGRLRDQVLQRALLTWINVLCLILLCFLRSIPFLLHSLLQVSLKDHTPGKSTYHHWYNAILVPVRTSFGLRRRGGRKYNVSM